MTSMNQEVDQELNQDSIKSTFIFNNILYYNTSYSYFNIGEGDLINRNPNFQNLFSNEIISKQKVNRLCGGGRLILLSPGIYSWSPEFFLI